LSAAVLDRVLFTDDDFGDFRFVAGGDVPSFFATPEFFLVFAMNEV